MLKKRVLFVDDDSSVLDGLRRVLRPMRQQWEMRFASRGREALEVLSECPCDVVVSEIHMPEMDGLVFLGEVAQRFPNVVRIVLSSEFDRQRVSESIRITHQHLFKPCETNSLIATVARACSTESVG